MNIDYSKLSSSLVSDLHPRTNEILVRRFGLQNQSPQTLEAIGHNFGITRERVRQITEAGMVLARQQLQKKQSAGIAKLFSQVAELLKRAGGFKREDLLLGELQGQKDVQGQHIIFLLELSEDFLKVRGDDYTYPFWADGKEAADTLPDALRNLEAHFEKQQRPLSYEELKKSYRRKVLLSHLEAARNIEQGFDGRWGLVFWPEISPRGVRDKAYLVLKREGKPLHFTQVTSLINELYNSQEYRSALIQTVHNELIKDPRFILVGRGLYGLQEWGLQSGTVRDVLLNILAKAARPMARQELLEKTLQQRFVEEGTVLLNLQNRQYFARDEEGRYFLIK